MLSRARVALLEELADPFPVLVEQMGQLQFRTIRKQFTKGSGILARQFQRDLQADGHRLDWRLGIPLINGGQEAGTAKGGIDQGSDAFRMDIYPSPFVGNLVPIDDIRKTVTSVRKYRTRGYEVRNELWAHDSDPKVMPMRSAYSLEDGSYIGNPKDALALWKRFAITYFEKTDPSHSVCSIGFSERDQKWYGWSHRAICGFGIGDRIYQERYGNDRTPFVKHGEKPVRNMDDAKLAATRFAGSVS